MSKVLFISNIAKRVGSFSIASIKAAHELDVEFHMFAKWNATDDQIEDDERTYNVKIHSVDLDRSPYSPRNYKAYKQLIRLIREEKIDYIHCNTPVGGILGRLAGKKCKVKKVIYQAHGFHFYKGAPKKHWLLYYTVEKWLARYTDALITINAEDLELAKTKLKLRKNGKVYYVPGVGIDTAQYAFSEQTRAEKRMELGLLEHDVALISMGDLIERKNYDTSIRAVAEANDPALHYFICGRGPEEASLKQLAESLGVSKQVHFLGFRSDIKELLTAADIFLFTTKQEGLPRSMMEAMASGLPCIASRIRGNTDLLEGTEGGFLCETTDVSDYAEKLKLLAGDAALRQRMGKNNLVTIKKFSIEAVSEEIRRIYEAELAVDSKDTK
ncbi:MAG: glycosyltransferase family 4 protein [Ruminococcaceae bacterium]|nr:glycosyltransferase family 4 protein [Oscillospiraceae bacterium]